MYQFSFREYCGGGKTACAQKPHICTLGPTIATDPKHYLQQSEYSVCVRREGEETCFASYEDVEEEEGQDELLEYNFPGSEALKVLGKLDLMNITAYSLFNSESSLMETLALREMVLKWGQVISP